MSCYLFFIGVLVGLLGGLFGKGGSAVATPLLQLAGVPAFFAIASPLPATIPRTLVASLAYLKEGMYDWFSSHHTRSPSARPTLLPDHSKRPFDP